MRTTYHVGEIVIIKNPLTRCQNGLNDDMKSMAGQIVTITYAFSDSCYRIKEDRGSWTWCVDCFDPYCEEDGEPLSLEELI